ncbi:MAG: ribonuclease E/G, partial [Actinomycetota bacterium]
MSSPELPEHPREGRLVSPESAEAAIVRKPRIGDTRPAPVMPSQSLAPADQAKSAGGEGESRRGEKNSRSERREKAGRRGNRRGGRNRRRRGGRKDRDGEGNRSSRQSIVETDAELIERRKGKERNGRPLGRYMMCVQVRRDFTQVAMLEGRSL